MSEPESAAPEAAAINELEAAHPGLTAVQRDADGAILLDDSEA